ncbi:MAG: ATP-dependent RecD-like DNA helicase [Clostridiales bacterium]|nr:ATP-dependent RecD-like DNA helicase [Clostridiales bacterium]
MEQLAATVLDTTFRNDENGYSVVRVLSGVSEETVVGALPQLSAGEMVTFTGDWSEHPVYGRQFSAKRYEIAPPDSLPAIERYLGSGLIRGVGAATAKLIVGYFGMETIEMLDKAPYRLVEIAGIGPKRAKMISESYTAQVSTRRVMIFLQNYGITPGLAAKIAKKYGSDTIPVIKGNPYRLVLDIDGVGFLTADRIALSMGVDPHSEFRLRSALYHLLSEAANGYGHTYLPAAMLKEQASRLLGIGEDQIENQITQALLQRIIISTELPGQEEPCLCLPYFFHAEQEIATRLSYLMDSRPYKKVDDFPRRIAELEARQGIELSELQRKAVRGAVEEGVIIITGGPGTGKTTIIKCILQLLEEDNEIMLCAPTGRAAKRMTEATGAEAKTIHRMLEYNGEANLFQRKEENPLETDCLIVDEMSMVDVTLMRALLSATMPGTRLILVGDADQLPSVGAGNVLRDMLASGILPSVRLTEIFRQAEQSMIVRNSHRINEGMLPYLNAKGSDFFFERSTGPAAAAKTICDLLQRRLPEYLKIPEKNRRRHIVHLMQVLTPTKKGDCGSVALNRVLQNALNPKRKGLETLLHGDTEFRQGDKVIHIKNNYQIVYIRDTADGREEGTGVFNGDVGYIESIDADEHRMTVCFDEERYVSYQKEQLELLELAYCLTVHKSQGSEFPVVVMPVVGGPPMLMVRNLLYTALTRARELVVLVGQEDVIARMVHNNRIVKRYTTLKARLEAIVQ